MDEINNFEYWVDRIKQNDNIIFCFKSNLICISEAFNHKIWQSYQILHKSMEKQSPSFIEIVKTIQCPKHNQPIVLVCIQAQCHQVQRTFCFQCNDQAQLKKNTHVLISTKKFDSMYQEYKDNLKVNVNKEPYERLKQLKDIIINRFNDIETILSQANDQEFIEGEEEQILKGKLNNLLKNSIWTKILDMKNSKISDSKLYDSLNQQNQHKNKIALDGLTNLQKSLQIQFQTFITALKLNKMNIINIKQQHIFSSQRKNTNLRLSKDRRAVSNSSEYGHYFCLTEKDFDIYNCQFRFNMSKMVENVSYWIGFTFPSLSENKKWTNIYDQGKGGFFIVIYQDGKKINFWNHQKVGFSTAEELKCEPIKSYNSISLRINFESKDLQFSVESEGKRNVIKCIKPIKWYGKIYPAVGFYGKDGNICIE